MSTIEIPLMASDAYRHLDDEQVEQYSFGGGPAEEQRVWEEHLLICQECRGRVEQSDRYVAAMRGAGERVRQEARERGRRRRRFPRLIPALIAAAVGIGALILYITRPAVDAAPVAVALVAARGPASGARVPAGAPLSLKPDLKGLPEAGWYRLEVVDRVGNRKWQGSFPGGAAPAMPPGLYFVRVYSPGGELYREYGLEVVKK